MMQTLLQNVRYSLRVLRKNPGLTLTVLLTLALGIGANTAIFTVDYATLLAPLPYPHPEQLVVVWSKIKTHHNGVAAGDFTDWRRQNTVFEDMCAWTGGSFNIATHDQPEYIEGRRTTPGFYKMLGYRFLMGRDFLPEEGEVGRNHEVILMYKLWKRLGSNSHIVGTTMLVDGEPHIVVGVLAPGMADRGQGEMVTPIAFRPEQLNHDFHWLLVMEVVVELLGTEGDGRDHLSLAAIGHARSQHANYNVGFAVDQHGRAHDMAVAAQPLPQFVHQNDFAVLAYLAFFGQEVPAHQKAIPEHFVETGRGASAINEFGLIMGGDIEGAASPRAHVLEDRVLVSPVGEVSRRYSIVIGLNLRGHHHQLVRMRIWQWREQGSVIHGEDRGIGANA